MRFCLLLNIVAVVLAIWARDPLLSLHTPFSGGQPGNITVGHAVLIGQPFVSILFLVFVAQLFRYTNILSQLKPNEGQHLDWRCRLMRNDLGCTTIVRFLCEIFRWFAMIALPVIASGFLLYSQFDFWTHPQNGKDSTQFSVTTMFDEEFSGKQPSYRSLQPDPCQKDKYGRINKKCQNLNIEREAIRERLPTLYQPWNFLIGSVLQILDIIAFIFVTFCLFFPATQ